jgi:DNA-directed RNA polymerase specialized sigma24 family protein
MPESSDVRFLNPKTLEVMSTETMAEFRAKRGSLDFRRDPEDVNMVKDNLLTVPANQEHRIIVTDVIRIMNKLPEPSRTIVYEALVEQRGMEEAAERADLSYGAVRQIVSRFRKKLVKELE